MNDFQIGPGAICKCCHDDAQGIDDSGLCPSCRRYTAELRAENERLELRLADVQDTLHEKCKEIERIRKALTNAEDLARFMTKRKEEVGAEVERLRSAIEEILNPDNEEFEMRAIGALALSAEVGDNG